MNALFAIPLTIHFLFHAHFGCCFHHSHPCGIGCLQDSADCHHDHIAHSGHDHSGHDRSESCDSGGTNVSEASVSHVGCKGSHDAPDRCAGVGSNPALIYPAPKLAPLRVDALLQIRPLVDGVPKRTWTSASAAEHENCQLDVGERIYITLAVLLI